LPAKLDFTRNELKAQGTRVSSSKMLLK